MSWDYVLHDKRKIYICTCQSFFIFMNIPADGCGGVGDVVTKETTGGGSINQSLVNVCEWG